MQMKSPFKKLAILAATGFTCLAATIPAAQAAPVSSNFNVDVTLTAVCVATNASAPSVDFGTYTAFGSATNASPTAALTFECTRGLAAPSILLVNGTLGTGNSFTPAAAGVTTSGTGVIAGLAYSLAVDNGAKTTTGATAPRIGNVDKYTYTITGAMAGGQAGDSTSGTSSALTLQVTY